MIVGNNKSKHNNMNSTADDMGEHFNVNNNDESSQQISDFIARRVNKSSTTSKSTRRGRLKSAQKFMAHESKEYEKDITTDHETEPKRKHKVKLH